MTQTNVFAERAAQRVDPDAVGFDPITIITIITTVLPLLMDCFNRFDASDPAAVKAEVKRQADRNYKRLDRRTARKIRQESPEKMSRAESFELAHAVIDEILETKDDDVERCCLEMKGQA